MEKENKTGIQELKNEAVEEAMKAANPSSKMLTA